MTQALALQEVPMNPWYRIPVMVLVCIVALTSPFWASRLFDAYLSAYSITDRQKENMIILQEQKQMLEQNCFSHALK